MSLRRPRRRAGPPGALALALLVALLAACREGATRPPHVILLLVDTLRADALSAYGHPGDETPRLDALAREGILFERVIAPSSWTKTSMASIFTARNPLRHGVRRVDDVLPRRLSTLAQRFAGAGYRTIGINTNPWLLEPYGFHRGFERYQSLQFAPADLVGRVGLSLLSDDDERPVFLYLHFMDVHAPYEPAGFEGAPLDPDGRGPVEDPRLERLFRDGEVDGREVRERLRARYQAEVRQLDAALGDLLDALEARGLARDAILVVTSDHGEAFGEHGPSPHGATLYPEVLEVPLILHAPARLPRGVRVAPQVRSIDLAPTLLELAGLPACPDFEGTSLLPLVHGRDADRIAVSAVGLNDSLPDQDLVSVTTPAHLFVRERRSDRTELYDLRADPGAVDDLGAEHPEVPRLEAQVGPEEDLVDERDQLDAATREQLRKLGYLGGER